MMAHLQIENSILWKTLKAFSYVIGTFKMDNLEQADLAAKYVTDICQKMNLTDSDIMALKYAVLVHDIGQLTIRESILKKTEKLTKEEFLEIQGHPIEGEKVLNMIPWLERTAQWVRWHHEWWDGSGYPDKLYGEKIPLPSRILAVVDAFTAMLNDRPYRPAMTKEEALTELKLMAGIQFDPKVVKIMCEVIE